VTAVEIEGVTRRLGAVLAVDDVSMVIEAGTVFGLLGPNGAGKSTLLTVAAGLRTPDVGQVRICGVDVHRDPIRAHRHLGLVAQDIALYPTVSVQDNLALFARLHGAREVSRRVGEVAESLGLVHVLDRRVDLLSGGERRRVHVGAAIMHRPDVVILDEPTTSLDPAARDAMLELVGQLAGEGAAICYSTNQIAEVERLAGVVAILDRGRVIAQGAPSALTAIHATPVVDVTFDGPAPIVDGPDVEVVATGLRFRARGAESAVAVAIGRLGEHAGRVRRVDVVDDDLEAVFLSLTGRRYRQDDQAART
jgi:ABC-2 type transport system ATP-binding protein